MPIFIYRKKSFSYNDNQRKTILQILRDNNCAPEVIASCNGNHTCQKCGVHIVSGNILRNGMVESLAGADVLACDCVPLGDIEVKPVTDSVMNILTNNLRKDVLQSSAESAANRIGVAIDLGVATLAAYFYNLCSGEMISIQSAVNCQRVMGEDVTSRIQYAAQRPDGLNLLQSGLVKQIEHMIGLAGKDYGFSLKDVRYISAAGNTVMEHFLAGLNVSSLEKAPFQPLHLFGEEIPSKETPFQNLPNAKIYLAPCVSGFVGGNITAGMTACHIPTSDDTVLYLDIGANGEIALWRQGKAVCCATHAGPIFEGVHISSGMAAQTGAISGVYVNNIGSILYDTVHDTVAEGICGSGLVDAVSVLLKEKIIDESGAFQFGDSYQFSENVFLTQKDIREIQAAKAAVCAGIMTLLKETGLTFDDVDAVLLAGGFGAKINPVSACSIGLIPGELQEKIISVGNASGLGAAEILLSPEKQRELQNFAKTFTVIDLSAHAYFNKTCAEQTAFPTL